MRCWTRSPSSDIYELQERYFALFDRSRTLSLHLFEHIHGESRDRGQAMADLVSLYAQPWLEMTAGELPDFLPLFLEFLSLLPDAEARTMLTEPAGILRALTDRLAERNTGYVAVMAALADTRAGAGRRRLGHPGGRPERPRRDGRRLGRGSGPLWPRRGDRRLRHRSAAHPPACRVTRRDCKRACARHDRGLGRTATMSAWLNNALYGWYPYVALTVFLLGSLLRFDHSQYTWRSGSSQLLRRKQ